MPASPLKNSPNLLAAGRITKAHGIKGEAVLVPTVEDAALLLGKAYLQHGEGEPKECEVRKIRVHHGTILLSLAGVTTRNQAEELRGRTLLIPMERLPRAGEDELYMFELPGLQVIYRDEHGQDRPLGEIASVDTPAGQEIWTITTPDGKEVLFPAAEEFILTVDLDKGTALIAPPPGLIELYLTTPSSE